MSAAFPSGLSYQGALSRTGGSFSNGVGASFQFSRPGSLLWLFVWNDTGASAYFGLFDTADSQASINGSGILPGFLLLPLGNIPNQTFIAMPFPEVPFAKGLAVVCCGSTDPVTADPATPIVPVGDSNIFAVKYQ